MSEIVRISTTGEICTIVAAYRNTLTDRVLLELQPVGRNQHRYVPRESVESATQRDMAVEVAEALTRAVVRYPLPEAQGISTQAGLDGLPLFEEVHR